ncbi:MAG TPA: hypothetical protein VNW46_05510 [Gemmatimonadaceae bacterium]|nr:hypothetical protein [Gemmatimonadaceae bacterium]
MTLVSRLVSLSLVFGTLSCASTSASHLSTTPPTPDPRVGLKGGWFDASQAIWNLTLVSSTPPSADFIDRKDPGAARLVNSDLAFTGPYVIQGNYSGYQIWDITNPAAPTLHASYVCPGSQSDVSVYGTLMFVSAEATSGRTDCGTQGVVDTVSQVRARGIRIFDVSDLGHPKPVTIVQTCRGSHTNTLVADPKDHDNVYIYVSGSSTVRSASELPGCTGGTVTQDPNTALFRLEVIRVPLAHPEQAAIVSSPRVFNDLAPAERHGESHADSVAFAALLASLKITLPPKSGPTQCHDITAYPAIGLAGGACGGYGILLDITDVAHPKRIGAVSDTNMAAWHSVTFNNDGSKVIFSDEWGGGAQPRCRPTDNLKWGSDAIYTISATRTMSLASYYKMSAPQTPEENCVAHNGSLIPIPGRDVMVQAWYQGGISVFDWTDASHPVEIGYFDRGPMDATKLVLAGYWSAYWYNGYIVGSEIARGLDLFALKPSAFISQHEIDAAKLVRFEWLNVQGQPQFVWPARFVVARAYLDQLMRDGYPRTTAIAQALDAAEGMTGSDRAAALTRLGTQLDADAGQGRDGARVAALAAVVKAMAADPAHAA